MIPPIVKLRKPSSRLVTRIIEISPPPWNNARSKAVGVREKCIPLTSMSASFFFLFSFFRVFHGERHKIYEMHVCIVSAWIFRRINDRLKLIVRKCMRNKNVVTASSFSNKVFRILFTYDILIFKISFLDAIPVYLTIHPCNDVVTSLAMTALFYLVD